MATAATKNINSKDASDVEAQIAQLREDIANLNKTIASVGANKASQYAEKAEKAGLKLAEASHGAFDSVKQEVQSLEKDMEDRVRNKPLQAVGIAAGIGFLLAYMTRR